MHLALLCLVLSFTGWIGSKFECDNKNNFCPSYETRRELKKQWNVIMSVVCGISLQIISPWCYYYMKNNSLRQDTVATVDQTLGEMIKLSDWVGIRELIAFGFLFDKQAYLNILFESNYQIIGYQTLWAIIEILAKNYNYTYNFSIMAVKHDSKYIRIIKLICDLKEKNLHKYNELKLLFDNQPTTKMVDGEEIFLSHFDMSLELDAFESSNDSDHEKKDSDLDTVDKTKKRQIYAWIKYWQKTDSIQYSQLKQYINNIDSYLNYGLRHVDKSYISYEDQLFKVVVLGAGGVGKSDLVTKFVNGQLVDDEYDPTIEDSYFTRAKVDVYDEIQQVTFVQNVTFSILDTALYVVFVPFFFCRYICVFFFCR